jgi:hypothetical protein
MNFKTYLDNKKMKPYVFANEKHLSNILVWRAYKGKPISGKNAMLLSAHCYGRVKITDLIKGDVIK